MSESDREELDLLLPRTDPPEPAAVASLRRDPASLMARAGMPADGWQTDCLRSRARQILLLCSRQAGKSTVSAALAVLTAVLSPGALVLLLSPTLRQSGELFRDKVLRMYNACGRPVATEQVSALQMTLANGSRVISLPGDEGTIRGYSGVSLLVIDEAARTPDELYKSVRPMLAVSGGRLIALSTPFGKQGWFYREWAGSGSWERVRVAAEQCPRIAPEFLAEELRHLGAGWYAQEYGCEFQDAGGSPLFPFEWLLHAGSLADSLAGRARKPEGMGLDPGEGVASTAWALVDRLGLVRLVSVKTLDTSVIVPRTIALIREYNLRPESVCVDRGGGGKQVADELRLRGYPVRTVAFGESAAPEPTPFHQPPGQKVEAREERYAYVNRRAQMYGELSALLDPSLGPGFAIGREHAELRRQLAPVPKLYDREGRLRMLPKNKRDAASKEQSLTELLGCSPDEADALCLAVHAMLHPSARPRAGAIG